MISWSGPIHGHAAVGCNTMNSQPPLQKIGSKEWSGFGNKWSLIPIQPARLVVDTFPKVLSAMSKPEKLTASCPKPNLGCRTFAKLPPHGISSAVTALWTISQAVEIPILIIPQAVRSPAK